MDSIFWYFYYVKSCIKCQLLLELHNAICLFVDVTFYQVKMFIFYNAQTINLTFVHKIEDIK